MSHLSTEFYKPNWVLLYKAAYFKIDGDNEKWKFIILDMLPGTVKTGNL